MARAITAVEIGDSIASYTLGQLEAFTVLALTFNLVPVGAVGGDNFAWLDYRDPKGQIIHLQPLAPGDGANMFYSLAVDAEPFLAENAQLPATPQNSDGSGYYYVSQRLAPIPLTGKCTINVYKTAGSESPPTDPITAIESGYTIPDLHLWVQDAGSGRKLPANSPPLLTHIAA